MTGTGFVISTARPYGDRYVVYGAVTDTLQRVYVMVPRSRSTVDQATPIIEAALAGLDRQPKPTGG